jgi:hypothetical protein
VLDWELQITEWLNHKLGHQGSTVVHPLKQKIESCCDRAVESHISRKTSEIWGTRPLLPG